MIEFRNYTKRAIAGLGIAFLVAGAQAQTNSLSVADYPKAVAAIHDKEGGMRTPKASPEELKEALAELQAMVPLAPTTQCRDQANACVACTYARMGDEDNAMKSLGLVTDPYMRNRRRLDVIFLLKGLKACIDELERLCNDPAFPKVDPVGYVEKVLRIGVPPIKNNPKILDFAVESLYETVVTAKNLNMAGYVFEYCADAAHSGRLKPAKYKALLDFLMDKSQSPAFIGTVEAELKAIHSGGN